MPKVKYKVARAQTNKAEVADYKRSRKTRRITASTIALDKMTSAELIDVFAAVKAIDKGISHAPTTSVKASLITRKYLYSSPFTRKRMLESISKTIVERNARENPATPEMIAKIKKTLE